MASHEDGEGVIRGISTAWICLDATGAAVGDADASKGRERSRGSSMEKVVSRGDARYEVCWQAGQS